MSLGKKLAVCFISTSAVAAVLGISSWVCVSKLKGELDHSVHQTAQRVEVVSDIKTFIQTVRFAGRGVLLYSSIGNPAEGQKNKALFAASVAGIAAKVRDLRPLLDTAAQRHAAH